MRRSVARSGAMAHTYSAARDGPVSVRVAHAVGFRDRSEVSLGVERDVLGHDVARLIEGVF